MSRARRGMRMLQLTGTKHPRPAPVYLDGYATVWAKHMLNTRAREVTSIGMLMAADREGRRCVPTTCASDYVFERLDHKKIFLKKRCKKSFYHILCGPRQGAVHDCRPSVCVISCTIKIHTVPFLMSHIVPPMHN